MPDQRSHRVGALQAIAARATATITAMPGVRHGDHLDRLRAYDAVTAELPARDLYLLLRDAEHAVAVQDPSASMQLRRLQDEVEALSSSDG